MPSAPNSAGALGELRTSIRALAVFVEGAVAVLEALGAVGKPLTGGGLTVKGPRTPQDVQAKAMAHKMNFIFNIFPIPLTMTTFTDSSTHSKASADTSDFLPRAQALLALLETTLEQTFDTLGVDVDLVRNGSVLNVNLAGKVQQGKTVVINLQSPMQQVWLATPFGGFHYAWDGSTWLDTRGGVTLSERLSQDLSAMTGQTIAV